MPQRAAAVVGPPLQGQGHIPILPVKSGQEPAARVQSAADPQETKPTNRQAAPDVSTASFGYSDGTLTEPICHWTRIKFGRPGCLSARPVRHVPATACMGMNLRQAGPTAPENYPH